jgi:hypothetical protein
VDWECFDAFRCSLRPEVKESFFPDKELCLLILESRGSSFGKTKEKFSFSPYLST